MSTNSPAHADYRPDIDGLRALAVLAVLVFHAFTGHLPGGFLGVDVFFAISGYVITRQLATENAHGQFSLLAFYCRRARRIFPSLAVVLVAVVLAGQQLLFRHEFAGLVRSLVAAVAFVSNLYLWQVADYFGPDASTQPLLHLWSLGIEEQFYLFWPLLLSFAWARGRVLLPALLLAAASCVAAGVTASHDANAVFYLPQYRVWELFAGAVPALVEARAGQHTRIGSGPALWREALAAVAVLVLLASVRLLHAQTPQLAWWRLLTMAGAATLLALPQVRLSRWLLGNALMRYVGRISYPLYLIHWPLLVFLTIQVGAPSRSQKLLALGLSVVLAALLFHLVETPIRRQRATPRLGLGLAGALVLVALGAVALDVARPAGLDAREALIENALRQDQLDDAAGHNHIECGLIDLVHDRERVQPDPACLPATAAGGVLLWGDSHALQLRHALEQRLPHGMAIAQLTTFGCAPRLLAPDFPAANPCDRANLLAGEAVRRLHPAVVVLAQREHHLDTDWPAFAAALHGLGARQVVVIGPVPQWTRPLPRLLALTLAEGLPERRRDGLDPVFFDIDRALATRLAGQAGVRYHSMIGALCNAEGCLTHFALTPLPVLTSVDYGHLTLPAADFALRDLRLAPD